MTPAKHTPSNPSAAGGKAATIAVGTTAVTTTSAAKKTATTKGASTAERKAPAAKKAATKTTAKKTTATKTTATKTTATKTAATKTAARKTAGAAKPAAAQPSTTKKTAAASGPTAVEKPLTAAPPAGPGRGFAAGRDTWLARVDTLRQRVRQDVVLRQLEVHMPLTPATVLDVGAGQGTLAIALARQGYDVTAVEPDAGMRAAFEAALAQEKPAVREKVTLLDEELDTLDEVFGVQDLFDVVVCHGVLMYLPDPNPVIRILGRRLAEDGILSVLAKNAGSLALRHALQGDADAANAALDEVDKAKWDKRDPMYTNGIGVTARADNVERLGAFFGGSRVGVESWYGVRCVSDGLAADAPLPESKAELQALLDLEYRLGRTEPYKRMGSLIHLVGRRGAGRGPQITW